MNHTILPMLISSAIKRGEREERRGEGRGERGERRVTDQSRWAQTEHTSTMRREEKRSQSRKWTLHLSFDLAFTLKQMTSIKLVYQFFGFERCRMCMRYERFWTRNGGRFFWKGIRLNKWHIFVCPSLLKNITTSAKNITLSAKNITLSAKNNITTKVGENIENSEYYTQTLCK